MTKIVRLKKKSKIWLFVFNERFTLNTNTQIKCKRRRKDRQKKS